MSLVQKITALLTRTSPFNFWLLLGGLALLCCLLGWLLYQLVKASAKKLLGRLPIPHTRIITKPFRLLALIVLLIIMPLVERLVAIPSLASLLLGAIPTFLIALTFYQSVNGIATYLCHVMAGKQGRGHIQLAPLITSLLKVVVVIAGTLLTLRKLHFDVTPLLTSISIGGIGFALASQDLFKNLFGSLIIFMDQPFRVGDTIAAKDIEGTVEAIGLRATRLVTKNNAVTYVPNAQLANAYVNNYGTKKYNLFESHIELAYNTPAELMEKFIKGLKEIVADHPYIRKDQRTISLEKVQGSMLQVLFCVYLEVGPRAQEDQYKEEVQHCIRQLAKKIGISLRD